MIKTKKRLGVVIGGLLASVNAVAHADVPVKIFTQNIQAAELCGNNDKKTRLLNYIQNNQFDFILTQEYEDICPGLFDAIKGKGYAIADNIVGDSTLFYKKSVWSAHAVSKIRMTSNTPDGWHGEKEGIREAVIGFFDRINSKASINIGNTHLCVTYPRKGGGYSKCVMDENEAHKQDFDKMINAAEGVPNPNWVIAGDMNASLSSKSGLITKIKGYGAKNIDDLNNQVFDMAFYKGSKIVADSMRYHNTGGDLPNTSDHNGFVLSFTLKE